MNAKTIAALAATAIALLGTTGCITSQQTMMPGNIIASNKPVEQGKYIVLNGGNTVTGKYKANLLNSSKDDVSSSAMKRAIDEALAQCPGADALIGITTDQRITNRMWVFPPFPLELSLTTFVTGIPIKTKE